MAIPVPSQQQVFDRLVAEIVSGRYAPGARVPAERDLALTHKASRPTIREALRRLEEWRLITRRRGSGIVVRDQREWSFDVLPAYLRYGAPAQGPKAVAGLIVDLLALRRTFVAEILRAVAPRLRGVSLDRARAAVHRAWAARDEVAAYVREDFEIIRAIVEAARFLPAVWFLSSLGSVYLELADTMRLARTGFGAAEHYVHTHERLLAALERGDGETAHEVMAVYLAEHDRKLLAELGVKP